MTFRSIVRRSLQTLLILLTLGNSFYDPKNISNGSASFDKVTLGETHNHLSLKKPSNAATLLDGRCEGKFVSPNVINLSKRHLFEDEISLFSKGLKFVPTPKHINKVLIEKELETYSRKHRLMWHYRNEERETIINPLKKKSKFNSKRKYGAIEIYLSRLEIFSLDKKFSYLNVTKKERHDLYSLMNPRLLLQKLIKPLGL